MACGVEKAFEHLLKCPICHGKLKDAKLLSPCGHTFCKECLSSLINHHIRQGSATMECPLCRKIINVINMNTDNLVTNFMANGITEALETAKRNIQKNACPKHPQNEMKFACEPCHQIVCCECVLTDHYQHGDGPKSLHEAASARRKDMISKIGAASPWIQEHAKFQSYTDFLKGKGNRLLDEVETAVNKVYNSRLTELLQTKKMMTDYITEQRRSFTAAVGEVLEPDKAATARVTRAVQRAKDLTESGRSEAIFTFYKDFMKQVNKGLAIRTPSVKPAEKEVENIMALYFEEGSPLDNNVLGRIRRRAIPIKHDSNTSSVAPDSYDEDLLNYLYWTKDL
ncbi:tripartite motif-containing protein 59-like [Diadema setosum]|uniref:tripartite motif-containing protein 59-like n=1 Tax=Diadema setosum TaxID=31175 RepID=UPI003B3A0A09